MINHREEPAPVTATIIVPYEAFVNLYNQVQELKQKVEILKVIVSPEWLNRKQAMAYLKCSSTKLWELQHNNLIEYTYNGVFPLYSFKSCQEYLNQRSVSKEKVQQRLKELFEAKQTKKKYY